MRYKQKNVKTTSFGRRVFGCGLGVAKVDKNGSEWGQSWSELVRVGQSGSELVRVGQSWSEWVRARFSTAQKHQIFEMPSNNLSPKLVKILALMGLTFSLLDTFVENSRSIHCLHFR